MKETEDSGPRRVRILSGEMPVAPFPALWGQTRAGTTFGLTSGGISIGLNGMCQYELGCRVSQKSPKSRFQTKMYAFYESLGRWSWLAWWPGGVKCPSLSWLLCQLRCCSHPVMEGGRPYPLAPHPSPAASAQESPSPGSCPLLVSGPTKRQGK